jgi:DNA (cytosine-5)-methyltransferase 1
MNGQLTIFDELYPKFKITKPIRLIEFFAGYGSQALALKYLGVKFEHWKICEWAVKSIQAYKDIHFTDVNDDWNKGFKIEDLQEHLFNLGISSNYNEPMTLKQIQRLPEKQLRQIHNNICNTNNLVNIQQVKGKDLEIEDKEDYCYILTYSFPCQDLSLAGKGKGMSDTSTRSGMLWEVERILTECNELGTLPQILLMENVPQVHGESNDNYKDFNKWQLRLEEFGYKNYWQDLIATDYGIPQTRNRCFMVSILGDYNYTFPKPIKLEKKLKDMLEDNVDEKYFLSDKMIKYISADNEKWTGNNGESLINKTYASTLNTREGMRRCDSSNYISNNFEDNYNLKNIHKTLRETLEQNKIEEGINYIDAYNRKIDNTGLSKTISTRVDASNNTYIAIKNATKQGYLEATDGDGVDISSRMEHHRGTVQKGKTQTLTTMGGENNGVVSKDLRIRKLTPREAFRLMGVKDEDFEKVKKNQSDSSLYHLAGDSLVTLVFCAIISTMIDSCKSFEQVVEEFYLQISN